jgi:hypothetical protein
VEHVWSARSSKLKTFDAGMGGPPELTHAARAVAIHASIRASALAALDPRAQCAFRRAAKKKKRPASSEDATSEVQLKSKTYTFCTRT